MARISLLIAVTALLCAALVPVVRAATVAPDVKNLAITPKAFKAQKDGGPVAIKGGGLVEFDLRDGARITFTFRTVKIGHREGGKCKPGKPKSVKKQCEILGPQPGTMLYEAFSGHNEFRFSGKVDNAVLAPGTYRLFAKAAGTAPRSSSAPFKIIR
jgi:hypothetical protein